MTLARALARGRPFGLPAGGWRWAALGFAALALVAGAAAIAAPDSARWAGVALLAGIGAVGSLFLYAVWPREGMSAADARRTADAASRANVAWAVTGADGAVADCNDAYRLLVGAAANEAPPPPAMALAGEDAAAALYRLSRAALDGEMREEVFPAGPGVAMSCAVRPIGSGETAWWFAPRLADTRTRAAASAAPPAILAGAVPVSFGEFFRHAPVGVAMADAGGRIGEMNGAFEAFFGAGAKPAGKAFADLVEPADRAAAGELIAGAAAGTARGEPVEVRPLGVTDRMAQLYASPVAGSQEGARAILYLVDVSEQKALETKFAQSQKLQAVGQLAGGVAHDFNNLLTVIIGNSEFLLMRHPAGDPSFRELNEVHQNALRAASLVGQLLAFSRKQTLQPKVLALRDVLGELANMLRRLLREGIVLRMEHGRDLWPVRADETQISNAIINLVVNARDAMPSGGTVAIATANETLAEPRTIGGAVMPAGDYVRIDVADTGTGIPEEHLPKIFDPFFTTKGVGQGTGLGLATVYGIVKQTGGFIDFESRVGKGTVFRIHLPRHKPGAEAREAPVEGERARARDVTGQDTVLLVEDEDAVRSFAARALRMRGYNVLEAAGGEAALDIVRRHDGPIHLLVTDVVMPSMDGPTLVRAASQLRPDMRVIYMSGYAEETFRRNDEKAEELHFLPKPFGLKQLAAKVKDVLTA